MSLHIFRGLPGSGKSTAAKKLQAELNCQHYEADQWFINMDGEYFFRPADLGAAHQWCYTKVMAEIYQNRDVIISNTFTQFWELDKYFEGVMSSLDEYPYVENMVPIVIYTLNTQFGSSHGVPESKMEVMRNRFISSDEVREKTQRFYPELMNTTTFVEWN